MGQLLIFEGPDGVGKTTLSLAVNEATLGSRRLAYGPPRKWHRTWHDAWGLDLVEAQQKGVQQVISDRGLMGHAVWHQLIPEANESLLVTAVNLGDMLAEVQRDWVLRVVILMRSRRGMMDELASRGEDHRVPLDSVRLYYSLHRTLVDLGVDAQIWESGAALARDPRSWWE